MSGLLRPVGPESAQTYWARRGLVFGAAMVLTVAMALIVTGTSSGSAAQPNPPIADYNSVPDAASMTPTYQSSASPSPIETAPRTPSLVDLSTSTPSTIPATRSAKPRSPTTKKKTEPVRCSPEELRPTLTGKQRLEVKQDTTFQLSLINGSDQTCIARVTGKNFELRIDSGSDHIWSSGDCPSMIESITRKLGSEHAVAWSLTWNGKRSKSTCKSAHEALRPGAYVATAQLDGAEPVKLRMILSERN
jgi:hypothetical protein